MITHDEIMAAVPGLEYMHKTGTKFVRLDRGQIDVVVGEQFTVCYLTIDDTTKGLLMTDDPSDIVKHVEMLRKSYDALTNFHKARTK